METRLPLTSMVSPLAAALFVLGAPRDAHADPKPTKAQCVAANETGQDLRRLGKLQDARASFTACLGGCPSAVRQDCAERLAEIDRATPTVVLAASDAAGNDLTQVRVLVDGEPFAATLDGKAAPLDPGEHHFRFEADGLPVGDEGIVLAEGEKDRRIHVVLGEPPRAPAPAPPPLPPPVPTGLGTRRTVAIGLLAGGALAAGAGAILGLVAKGTQDGALSRCAQGDPNDCPPQSVRDSSTAYAQATVSTVAFAAAGAFVVAGIVVYVTGGPSNPTGSASVGLGIGDHGVTLRGTW